MLSGQVVQCHFVLFTRVSHHYTATNVHVFFLPSSSLINMYIYRYNVLVYTMYMYMYMYVYVHVVIN